MSTARATTMRNAHRQTAPGRPANVPSGWTARRGRRRSRRHATAREARHCRAETTTGAEPNGTTHPRTAPRIAAPHRAPPHRTAHHRAARARRRAG
ncbi:hypothetical protein, partial [Streptomyces hygroscopicus]